jgi:hypothetical protein
MRQPFETSVLPWLTTQLRTPKRFKREASKMTIYRYVWLSALMYLIAVPMALATVATETVLTTSGTPVVVTHSVTFTAVVSASSGTVPNGELVTFSAGSTVLGTAPLAAGTAKLSTTTLKVGSDQVRAAYSGDASFAASTGTLLQVVTSFSTTTTLTSALNPANYGQKVLLTASVSSAAPGGPTGVVVFKNGTTTLGEGTLSSGFTATWDRVPPGGTDQLTATYTGDSFSGKSTSAVLTEQVNPASTTTSVGSSINPVSQGQPVTFTATVQTPPGLAGFPQGSVTFLAGTTVLGSATLATGKTTFTTATLSQGSVTISAKYSGNSDFSPSAASWLQQVAPPIGAASILVQPATQTVNLGQSVTFSVLATGNSPLTYQWFENGTAIPGATSATYVTPPIASTDIGAPFHVMVSNPVQGATSNTATLQLNLYPGLNVLTYHNDTYRSGQNLQETTLTPANVNTSTFGKLFSVPVDGQIYTQPLYLSGVSIPGNGTHNVIYVATEHDGVFAYDADASGPALWSVSFINPAAGITTLNNTDVACTAIPPEVGITGTPVIDPSTGTMFLVARTKENGVFVQRLHALDVTTGAEKFGGPVPIQASVPGIGAGAVSKVVSFNPQRENQRGALIIQNGMVFITWASLCDIAPYHGWVMAYDTRTLAQLGVWNSTPNGNDGGIWSSGEGPSGDGSSLFFATGNGSSDIGNGDYGSTVVRLAGPSSGSFMVVDYFTPFNYSILNAGDVDLGSGGVLLVDQPGSQYPHELFSCGKEGTIYVVDRDNMGGVNTTFDNVVESIPFANVGTWNSAAWWNGTMYLGSAVEPPDGPPGALTTYDLNPGLGTIPTTPNSATTLQFKFPAPTPSISANGSSNGIVWAIQESNYMLVTGQAALMAYDATNLANLLYSSTQNAARDNPGLAVKFGVPTIVNGKVYVATKNQVSVYGLLP